METQIIPTKIGQIVKPLVMIEGIEPDECFIIEDDPTGINPDDTVTTYWIIDYLLKPAIGEMPTKYLIKLNCLTVISDDLLEWTENIRNRK